jgi:hypothetical protein
MFISEYGERGLFKNHSEGFMKIYAIFFLYFLIFLSGMTLAQERQRYVKKTITLMSPKAGDEFKTTDSIPVSWKSEGITGNVKASLHKYQQSDVQTYKQNLYPTGSLTVPPESGNCL